MDALRAPRSRRAWAIKFIKRLACVALCALVFTALTAVLPCPPFILRDAEDLSPFRIGFPLSFVEQVPDSDSLEQFTQQDVSKSFVLPRYDKYDTYFDVGRALGCLAINTGVFGAAYLFFHFMKKTAKRALACLALGLAVTVASAVLPVAPGTFTEDDLYPMEFGFTVKFVEQTPSIDTTWPELDTYLAQNYIAPNYAQYATHIDVGRAFLCLGLNTLIIAVAAVVIGFFVTLARRGRAETARIYLKPFRQLRDYFDKKSVRKLRKTLDKAEI